MRVILNHFYQLSILLSHLVNLKTAKLTAANVLGFYAEFSLYNSAVFFGRVQ